MSDRIKTIAAIWLGLCICVATTRADPPWFEPPSMHLLVWTGAGAPVDPTGGDQGSWASWLGGENGWDDMGLGTSYWPEGLTLTILPNHTKYIGLSNVEILSNTKTVHLQSDIGDDEDIILDSSKTRAGYGTDAGHDPTSWTWQGDPDIWRGDKGTIDPQPAWEWFGITNTNTELSGTVDIYNLYSTCIPEPGTLSLIALMGLLAMRRGR